jgi:hypothetical protein
MGSMRNWMLGAAVVAAGLGLGAVQARAAEFGVYVRGPVAYVPPCPGPGYIWAAGYWANGYWVPGRWNFAGPRERGAFVRYEGGWGWGHDRFAPRDRGWGRERFRR